MATPRYVGAETEAARGGQSGRGGLLARWKSILGIVIGFLVLAWLFSRQDLGTMWRALTSVETTWLLPAFPLIVVDMLFRALRWWTLLGRRADTHFGSIFSALMVGYLANNLLPARGGDLVRVYALGNKETLARSRILATLVVERVLDLATIVFVFAVAAAASPLPDWMRKGGLILAAGTAAGVVGLLVLSLYGAWLLPFFLRPVSRAWPGLGHRLEVMAAEFTAGVHRFRRPSVAAGFFGFTAAVWVCEIAIVLVVGRAFGLGLSIVDGLTLMLFSLFSSLMPAMPGQIGTFELAMTIGLEYLGHHSASALAFALALHFSLLVTTSLLGAACLMVSGGNLLLPPRLTGEAPKVAPSSPV